MTKWTLAKFLIAGAMLLFTTMQVTARTHDQSEYPLKAHVVASGTTPKGKTSSYDPGTRHWSYGVVKGMRQTDIQIDQLVYATDTRCKVAVGSDYPAKLEKKSIRLLVGPKECKGHIEGSREAGK